MLGLATLLCQTQLTISPWNTRNARSLTKKQKQRACIHVNCSMHRRCSDGLDHKEAWAGRQRKSVQNLKSSKTDDCNKLKQPANFVSYRKDISMHAKCSTVDQYKTVSGLTETHAKPSPRRKGSPARVCKARYWNLI
jgi:hypothetical protein